ncbi:MAG TPA: methyltransferase domain-containing protein [Candidatus Binatia bacterium]|nr:methyltransferase domain-containing protein [Candidatus Binatia bacterium]
MSKSKSYTWDAKNYAKNSQNQFQWAQELIPKLKLRGNESLLDIGCGDGKISAEIAKCLPNGKVIGIDSSAQMINLAQSTFPNQEHPNLSFQVMDARKIAFSQEFDLIFSNATLHWIDDQKSVLQNVYKRLKHRGRLIVQMAGKGNAQDIISILSDLLTESPWKEFFEGMTFPYGFFSAEEYRAFLDEAGLKALRVEMFPRDMKHAGAEGLAGWIRTTWLPYTERLPIEKRDVFVKEIVARYLKNHPADIKGVVHLGMMRLEVEAYKP